MISAIILAVKIICVAIACIVLLALVIALALAIWLSIQDAQGKNPFL